MPVHDWTRVDAGLFHDFHHAWIEEIKRALNRGLLPPDHYALAEQIAGGLGPDVLTLQGPTANGSPLAGSAGGALALATAPQRAVPFLKEKLPPVGTADRKQVERLLADLDRDDFAVREKAAAELVRLGRPAEPMLRRALKGELSAEVRHRVVSILDRLKADFPRSERLRVRRAVEALEHAATPEALKVLQGLARGNADALETREARAALDRLTDSPAGAP
jgi:hypothetical protein